MKHTYPHVCNIAPAVKPHGCGLPPDVFMVCEFRLGAARWTATNSFSTGRLFYTDFEPAGFWKPTTADRYD